MIALCDEKSIFVVVNAVLKVLKNHISNQEICENGCNMLLCVSNGKGPVLGEICEKEGLVTLLEIRKRFSKYGSLSKVCDDVFDSVIASREARLKIRTAESLSSFVAYCNLKKMDKDRIDMLCAETALVSEFSENSGALKKDVILKHLKVVKVT